MLRSLSGAWILCGGWLLCAAGTAWAAQAPAACCMPNGTCVELQYTDCVAQGGFPQDPDSSCLNGVPCSPIKWAQPPTQTPFSPIPGCFWGWDEPSVYEPPQLYPIMADDFACTSQRPITDVHWWGSYLNWSELMPPPQGMGPMAFHIGIWTDVPANDPASPVPWSHPGVLLWHWVVPRELLNEHAVGCDFHPAFMQMPETCFRYDFIIPNQQEWFYQEPGNNVYWLSISAIYPPSPVLPAIWGWKTRQPVWNDGAVRMYGPPMPQPGIVFDPLMGEPLNGAGEPWDLSFVLTTEPRPPLEPKWTQPPAATDGFDAASDVWIHEPGPGNKWEQLPDVNAGQWHAHDYHDGMVVRRMIVADDWLCEGGVVSDFHWWGSFEKIGSGLWGFHLSIHPQSPVACLPGDPALWEANVPIDQIVVTTETQLPDGAPLYRYDYVLPTPFPQQSGQTYWFDVSAISNDPLMACIWTWQRAAPDPPILCPPAYRDLPVMPQWKPLTGNMAFRVTSVDVPQPVVNKVVADDFVSDGRPIQRVRWWGSYLDPVFAPPPIDPRYEIDGWFISFHHESVSAPTCPPGIPFDPPPTVIGLYFAPASAVTVQGLDTIDCLGHGLYEYQVDLSQCCLICARPDPRTGFMPAQPEVFAEEAGLRYWLDIQAVVGIGWTPSTADPPCLPFSTLHRPHFVTGTDGHFWGWHTSVAQTMPSALDTACTGQLVWPEVWVAGDCPEYRGWVKQPWLCPFVPGPPVHMAFELLTPLPYQPQACCEVSGRCTMLDPLECVFVRNGKPQGPGSTCTPNTCPLCPGDMNCDGKVNFRDIDKFVEALGGQAAWEANPANAGCPWLNGDCNFDGNVTFKDIDPFVARLGAICGQ